MEKYVIKDDGNIFGLTDICRIGAVKRSGDEWTVFTKHLNIESLPAHAAVRFESQGVSGVYVNGSFVEANPGKYYNRITYAEFTSRLTLGDNEIKIVLSGHFYQSTNENARKRRGAGFSYVAAEFEFSDNSERYTVRTDAGWTCASDDGQNIPTCFSKVTKAEYKRFWLSAALIPEYRPITVPQEITETAGGGYTKYISSPWQEYAYPQSIYLTDMDEKNGVLTSLSDTAFVTYDFGKAYVGYLTLECTAEQEGEVSFLFDYSENPEDLDLTTRYEKYVTLLNVKKHLNKGENKIFLLRRRAFRYLKVIFNCEARITKVGLKLCMTPSKMMGYFRCCDESFNKMWEVGKYTLHINKHQEYESCPRNEMKFFSGDGVADGLVDYYAFGDPSVMYSSLSLTEPSVSVGLREDRLGRNYALTDYPAWRIICVYTQYLYFGDKYFAEQHYDELVGCIRWLIERMNDSYLIYQYPQYSDQYYSVGGVVEYTCSAERLGEKPYLNAVVYKSLLCMAELAEAVGDNRGTVWSELAEKVYEAFNDRLWDDEKKAYLDSFDRSYIPQDGNALALLFGLATGERAEEVKKTLRDKLWTPYGSTILSKNTPHTRGGSSVISPLMNMYEAEARFRKGDAEGAIELIKRCWGTMLDKGAGTFWEFSPNHPEKRHGLTTHAWSSGCTYLLSAYVLGVRPDGAGYEALRFEPYTGFDSFEGVVPTCKGLAAVKLRTVNGIKEFELAVPRGTKVNAFVPADAKLTVREYVTD